MLSSKKPVSRLKPTDLLPNPSRRDPRFDERCGKLNVDLFKKSYSFVTDLQTKERGMISEQLKAATDPDQKARLKLLLSRIVRPLEGSAYVMTYLFLGSQGKAGESCARAAEDSNRTSEA